MKDNKMQRPKAIIDFLNPKSSKSFYKVTDEDSNEALKAFQEEDNSIITKTEDFDDIGDDIDKDFWRYVQLDALAINSLMDGD